MNIYTFLADCILVFHFCYLLFTVGGAAVILAGGLLGWRMIRNRLFRLLHLGSVVFGGIGGASRHVVPSDHMGVPPKNSGGTACGRRH